LVRDVAEVVFIALSERAFAVRFHNGSALLFQAPTLGRMSITHWPGTYAAMSAGVRFMCLLNTTGHASCTGRSNFGTDDRTLLLEHRAHVRYSQISCGASFSCGLRANDSRVECFGMMSREEPLSLNSSALAYSSIAAQFSAYAG